MAEPSASRSGAPHLPQRRWARIVNPKSETGFSGWITGGHLVWLITHFHDNQPRPCTGGRCCAMCREGLNERGRAYCSFAVHPTREHALLELTEYAVEQLLALVDEGKSLRGLPISLRRRSRSKTAAVLLKIHDVVFPGVLPREFDPVPILRRFWRTDFRFSRLLPGSTVQQSAHELMEFSGDDVGNEERQASE